MGIFTSRFIGAESGRSSLSSPAKDVLRFLFVSPRRLRIHEREGNTISNREMPVNSKVQDN